jgi:hypothetical protein
MRAFALLALLLGVGCAAREDVLVCEEAVAHLGECCPSLDTARLRCDTAAPRVNQCILSLDCDGLKARGVCDAAQIVAFYEQIPCR